MGYFYETYVKNPLVEENTFLSMPREKVEPASFSEVAESLPQPFWQKHDAVIQCYWKAWELAFKNLKRPTEENGFIANYIGTQFNDCLFMWDSVFALMYGKYGLRSFNFQRTLDNLYVKQHTDGFICRELAESDGTDRFHRYDPSSTGPNVMPWSEWEHFSITGDKERLSRVFPVLAAYHRWMREYRTWPDGTYWTSGWGAGMDNQPRLETGPRQAFYHGHMVWLDACLQAVFSAKILLDMAKVLGREAEFHDFNEEAARLSQFINDQLWEEGTGFYYDLQRDGRLSDVKSIGAYWALLADIVPQERLTRFIDHLENTREFKRPHRIPSLSADTKGYCEKGDYWRGGVWVFTNYMVLRGLTEAGYDTIAHEIAGNDLDNVVKVFERTGTIWENYAPEAAAPGEPARDNFVGAGGVTPITVLLEYVFGLRQDVEKNVLLWDIRLLEEHGVNNYPFGNKGVLHIKCENRSAYDEEPKVTVTSNISVRIDIKWHNGSRSRSIFK
jgi:Trehalase